MKMLRTEQQGNVLVITLDHPEERLNKLDDSLMEEFTTLLDRLRDENSLRGAVLTSGKEDNFMAGADLQMFRNLERAEEFEELSRKGHRILSRIEHSPKPVVACIHGACMGGGTELALACRYRILSVDRETKIALPEVKLGLIPGMGGTQRLPRLIGIRRSLEYLLTGKNLYSRQAAASGFADETVYRHKLLEAGIRAVQKLSPRSDRPAPKLPLHERLLENNPAGRALLFSQAKKTTLARTKGNYPAPLKILEAIRYGYRHGYAEGLNHEPVLFGQVAVTPESKELIRLFFASNEAKKIPSDEEAIEVSRIGVLGAGLMGSGIAQISSDSGYHVWIKDRDLESAGEGKRRIAGEFDRRLNKKILRRVERDDLLSRIHATDSYGAFGQIDLVIEAVFEDLELKKKIVAELEEVVGPQTVIASNTSSLPIGRIAEEAARPERIIGMHYFSPVPKMPLLEVIRGGKSSKETIATACRVGRRQGKTVIVVNDGPGFYTTRVVSTYMNEALLLLEEGASIEQIDRTIRGAGFPVGPVTLLDEVGIDIGAHVAGVLESLFRERGAKTSRKSTELMQAGFLGRKNNRGFYRYEKGNKKEVNNEVYRFFGGEDRDRFDEEEIRQRLMMVMVNEAAHCLQDGILESARDGDLGAVLGLGFPPFLGGPFRHIDRLGISEAVSLLTDLEMNNGPRFRPADLLAEMEEGGTGFYD